MVQESREIWYMDDGELTKELCEEVQDTFEPQEDTILECTACDEAKYEVKQYSVLRLVLLFFLIREYEIK